MSWLNIQDKKFLLASKIQFNQDKEAISLIKKRLDSTLRYATSSLVYLTSINGFYI